MVLEKIKSPGLIFLLNLCWALWIPGSGGQELWGAPPGGTREAAGTERNPFAYPPRIVKEMAAVKTGDGKAPAAQAPPKEYALSGILWTDKGGVASINRRILREGEMLDEYRVWRIDRNKVILRKEGEEVVLNLFQSPVVITEHRQPRSPQKKTFR